MGNHSNHIVRVLLQVIEHKLTAAEKDEMKQELEATVGMQLDHPNVVRTLKHTTRLMSRVRCAAESTTGAGRVVARHAAGAVGSAEHLMMSSDFQMQSR